MSSKFSNLNQAAQSSSTAQNAGQQSGGANQQQSTTNVLNQSKDFQTMISVLKDMGVDDYEPRVVNQLLEFSYRYITNLLEDARAFSTHAGKKSIDSEDIKMAIKSKVDYSFTTTPPRDLLMEISKTKNKNPLPPIKYHAGIRLPPDRFCLHGQNFALKAQNTNIQAQQMQQQQQQQQLASRQTFNAPAQQTASVSRPEPVPMVVPSKRPRADEDDYDI